MRGLAGRGREMWIHGELVMILGWVLISEFWSGTSQVGDDSIKLGDLEKVVSDA